MSLTNPIFLSKNISTMGRMQLSPKIMDDTVNRVKSGEVIASDETEKMRIMA